jgi:hypothetical protein
MLLQTDLPWPYLFLPILLLMLVKCFANLVMWLVRKAGRDIAYPGQPMRWDWEGHNDVPFIVMLGRIMHQVGFAMSAVILLSILEPNLTGKDEDPFLPRPMQSPQAVARVLCLLPSLIGVLWEVQCYTIVLVSSVQARTVHHMLRASSLGLLRVLTCGVTRNWMTWMQATDLDPRIRRVIRSALFMRVSSLLLLLYSLPAWAFLAAIPSDYYALGALLWWISAICGGVVLGLALALAVDLGAAFNRKPQPHMERQERHDLRASGVHLGPVLLLCCFLCFVCVACVLAFHTLVERTSLAVAAVAVSYDMHFYTPRMWLNNMMCQVQDRTGQVEMFSGPVDCLAAWSRVTASWPGGASPGVAVPLDFHIYDATLRLWHHSLRGYLAIPLFGFVMLAVVAGTLGLAYFVPAAQAGLLRVVSAQRRLMLQQQLSFMPSLLVEVNSGFYRPPSDAETAAYKAARQGLVPLRRPDSESVAVAAADACEGGGALAQVPVPISHQHARTRFFPNPVLSAIAECQHGKAEAGCDCDCEKGETQLEADAEAGARDEAAAQVASTAIPPCLISPARGCAATMCTICFTEPVAVAFFPCGHSACVACAQVLYSSTREATRNRTGVGAIRGANGPPVPAQHQQPQQRPARLNGRRGSWMGSYGTMEPLVREVEMPAIPARSEAQPSQPPQQQPQESVAVSTTSAGSDASHYSLSLGAAEAPPPGIRVLPPGEQPVPSAAAAAPAPGVRQAALEVVVPHSVAARLPKCFLCRQLVLRVMQLGHHELVRSEQTGGALTVQRMVPVLSVW